eukprot:scaffold1012_cov45-Attheya_sp.AAC.1
MQQILDLIQRLQGKADAKDVYSLESNAKKVMDLMGFTTEEGEDLVTAVAAYVQSGHPRNEDVGQSERKKKMEQSIMFLLSSI